MDEPGCIRPLDSVVVDRIAAGEVIQRPCNAIKELLENSLDAHASNIQITLKDGGMKVLQIQDNGTGIRKEDMDIVCKRFTTSKLRAFEDLNSIATFGFRGEALASISHVAHLTITTKTSSQQCAFKASYEDGELKKGTQPKACAGNKGTLILVEDLFYNMPLRKRALKNLSDEFSRVAEVVSRYAVHNPSVGFTLKKHGDTTVNVKTNPNSTHLDNIRLIYGDTIARELLEINFSDDVFKFKVHGYITNANFSMKKPVFILFINNRLVDSSGLRKAIESVFSYDLPKGSFPFIYLSLAIDPHNVDVNVHPTKHEVHFLHEESIIDSIRSVIEKKLVDCRTSRVFYSKAKVPGINVDLENAVIEKNNKQKVHAKEMVRTDSTAQKIDKFFPKTEVLKQCEKPVIEEKMELKTNEPESSEGNKVKTNDPQPSVKKEHVIRREITLTSVLGLRKCVEDNSNAALREIIADSTVVGFPMDDAALAQHSTKLYWFNLKSLKEELFYQLILFDFGNFGAIKFQSPLSLFEVALIGIDDPDSEWNNEYGTKEECAKKVEEILFSKRELLEDYFSMEIDDKKRLCTIPLVLEKYIPDISRLPRYVLRLACNVDWTAERPCFEGIARETAIFFTYTDIQQERTQWQWTAEHIVFPALKRTLLPPKKMATDETFVELTDLQTLYKVFERC